MRDNLLRRTQPKSTTHPHRMNLRKYLLVGEKCKLDCHPFYWLPFCSAYSTCPELTTTRVGFCQFCATPRPAAAAATLSLFPLTPQPP